MQITLNIDQGTKDGYPIKRPHCARLCRLSITNIITACCLFAIAVSAVYICKTYTRPVLFWLENQDSTIISVCVILLFTLVSLPISVGYIVLVVADGYLFGICNGFMLTVVGANAGLFIAHNLLKLVAHHNSVRQLADNETAKAILRVISGPLCFKIVCCARLTPIPFGLQNTIFALSNVNGQIYHLASFLGLMPAQLVGVYVGSTLRSMQDVLENRNISAGTYLLIAVQLIFGASLMIWIGTKARRELLKALVEGENKLTPSEKGFISV